MMRYAPFAVAVACCAMMIVARLLTNRHVRAHAADIRSAGTTAGHIPPLFSVVYLLGILGLFATAVWGFFAIAWWSVVVVLTLYLLTGLVRSKVSGPH